MRLGPPDPARRRLDRPTHQCVGIRVVSWRHWQIHDPVRNARPIGTQSGACDRARTEQPIRKHTIAASARNNARTSIACGYPLGESLTRPKVTPTYPRRVDVDDDVDEDEVAEVIPLNPLTACMMRHPAGKRRDGYPPIRESRRRTVGDRR